MNCITDKNYLNKHNNGEMEKYLHTTVKERGNSAEDINYKSRAKAALFYRCITIIARNIANQRTIKLSEKDQNIS